MSSTDPAPVPSPSTRPRLIRRTFRRHGRALMAVWLLGTLAVGALVYSSVKPTYRALSLIRVDPSKPQLFNDNSSNESLEPFLQTHVQLITSPNVLTAAGANPKAALLERIQKAGDVVQELRKAVSVGIIPGTYLIEVSVTSSNAYEAATIVNAVVDAYLEANAESYGMTRLQIKNLEQYHVDLKNTTDELERQWKKLAARGEGDIPPRGDVKAEPDVNRINMTVEEYRQIQRDLIALGLELAEAQALLSAAQVAAGKVADGAAPADPQAIIEAQVTRRIKTDPDIIALADKVMQARSKLADLMRVVQEAGDPNLKIKKQKLAGLDAQYKQLYAAKAQAFREDIERGGFIPGREVGEASTVVNKLMARQVSLRDRMTKLDVKNQGRAVDAVDVALIQDERQTVRGMQEAVVRRLEQLRYEAKGESRIRPVNPSGAMVPGKPISDHRRLLLSLTPFALFPLVFACFAGIEAWSGPKVETKSEPAKPEGEGEGEV